MKKRSSLITDLPETSVVTESYKMFRTNLEYSGIDTSKQVLLFTSSSSEEGKTTSICNLAIAFANAGRKTLLVECDLRKSRVHELFEIQREPGLTSILAGKAAFSDVEKKIDAIENLSIVTAGPKPPSPPELLGSKNFENFIEGAKSVFDVILLDAPPVLVVTDALTVNKVADGVVLVVASDETKKSTVKKAKKTLDQVGANILGTLITKANLKSGNYYNYAYDSYYTEESKKSTKLFGKKS